MSQQTETKTDSTTFGMHVFEIASKVLYALRFEMVFLAGFALLWAVSWCLRLANVRHEAKSRSGKALLGSFSPRRKSQTAPARSDSTSRGKSVPSDGRHVHSSGNPSRPPPVPKDALALVQGQPQPSQLRDAAWLLPKLTQLCQNHGQRALELYRSALAAGLDLGEVPEAQSEQLLVALVTSLIRMGLLDDAIKVVHHLRQHEFPFTASLVTSCVKLCTAKHFFQECIAISDLMTNVGKNMPADRSVLSCLLFCAVESGSYHRCEGLFEELKLRGLPSQKDYWNMVRFASHRSDWRIMLELIQGMRANSLEVDSVIYNTALACCVSTDRMDEARTLLDEMGTVEGVTDVITYNTLMKGYAKTGKMDECFQLFDLMKDRGIAPSQVTYGILLDGCISDKQVDRAAKVFDIMKKEECPMNTVLYTTLIKGFAREGKVDEAMRVYAQMTADKNVPPDLITFSILLKVNCDAGRLETALQLLDDMLKLGLHPDEVIFNNLLTGCAKEVNAELAKRLYSDMVSSGIRPSNATFSILIRLYSQCKLLDEAVDMLRTEPSRHQVELEPRLFSQLIQCCVRARQGRRALDVYELMFEHAMPSAALHTSILGMCVKLNMFETAAELLDVAAKRGAKVDVADANLVLEGACRKKKVACADSCVASMKALGLPCPTR